MGTGHGWFGELISPRLPLPSFRRASFVKNDPKTLFGLFFVPIFSLTELQGGAFLICQLAELIFRYLTFIFAFCRQKLLKTKRTPTQHSIQNLPTLRNLGMSISSNVIA